MTLTALPDLDRTPPAVEPTAVPGPTAHWWVRGGRPAWSLPARAAITVLAALLYTWDLSRNGMGNSFYAAAVKSGTENWKAFLFGSLDPGNFITVDKPPASLWVMELSGRLFGFSSWSMLLPEALAGVATVLVLYHLVRRWRGEVAAVLAALAMALTPIAVVMFRYNNPDAFLTLLLVLSAWALWSALETATTWKLVACGGLLGLAFTTKMLQAFLVLPALGLVYLLFGRPRLGRRLVQLLWSALALVVSAGWWVALVELWPAASRPYVGGSTNDSELNLIFGYNGLARIFGNGGGAPGGTSRGASVGGPNFGGTPGLLRLFNSEVGGQISWLIPLALMGLVAGLWLTRRNRRTDLGRAGFVLWGGWVLVTMVVFSFAQGIFHPYYTVALAPGLAALAAGGAVAMWRLGRDSRRLAWVLPLAVLVTAAWAIELLHRSPGYDDGLSTAIAVGAVLSALGVGLALLGLLRGRWLVLGAGVVATATVLAGPAAYSLTSVRNSYDGPTPSAGPAVSSGGLGGAAPGVNPSRGAAGGLAGSTNPGGTIPGGTIPGGTAPGASGGGPGGSGSVNAALVRYLQSHRSGAEYLVAVSGSQTAAPYILATGDPVMAMGGFTGSDPAPTLAQFKQLVAEGKVHYVLVGGGGLPGAGGAPGAGGSSGFPGPSGAPGGGAAGAAPFADGGPPGLGPLPGGAAPAGSGAAGGGGAAPSGGGHGTVSAVDAWVEANGHKVTVTGDSGATLYYVTSAAARR